MSIDTHPAPPEADNQLRGSTVPQVVTEGRSLRRLVQAARGAGKSVGLIPTMGALHEGHLSLVDAARSECDLTFVTIFVNPTQFAPHEDFENYPRDLARDLALLGTRGCDVVFTPNVAEMYPPGNATSIDVGPIAQTLEGEHRPTHFRGVATVVLKLFHSAPVDRAYFGRKDYQQTLVIRRLVDDLNVPIELRICPIVREPDGLAMSSRNAYLSADERRWALALSHALRLAENLAADGERSALAIERKMRESIARSGGVEVQYIALVADGTVTPVAAINGPTTVVLAAVVGRTRLIDNTLIG
jgi:pantoate--beta-alanine ligase